MILILYVKVPGRMGMIITLYLISANVYNAVDAPNDRGFSYIEIWMVGTQFPILLALCEYGLVLYLKKVDRKPLNPSHSELNLEKPQPDLDERIKRLDFATMVLSLIYLITFVLLYLTVL